MHILMSELEIEERDDGVVFAVKVVPGSSRTAVAGLLGAKLKVNHSVRQR